MPRVKVTFKQVEVSAAPGKGLTVGQFLFRAKVNGEFIGEPEHLFHWAKGAPLDLPQPAWSKVVEVDTTRKVSLEFQYVERDFLGKDAIRGTLHETLSWPFQQLERRSPHPTFQLEWQVEIEVDGKFGRHPPARVYACRQVPTGFTCTTVDGSEFPAWLEFHPVRPVPLAPHAQIRRPKLRADDQPCTNFNGTEPTSTDPINIIPNPPVIPLLDPPPNPERRGTPSEFDHATWANFRNCARLEFTYYAPETLAFDDDDKRLEWRVVSTGGGDAAFLGAACGTKVMVYGTQPGAVRFEVYFRGTRFATYRALVDRPRQVPCRVNLLIGRTRSIRPRVNPDDTRGHIFLANRYLRQLGLELVFDTDRTTTHGARRTEFTGIFEIPVRDAETRRLSPKGRSRAVVMNHRPGVMNFCYVHSHDNPHSGGTALHFPPQPGSSRCGADTTGPHRQRFAEYLMDTPKRGGSG